MDFITALEHLKDKKHSEILCIQPIRDNKKIIDIKISINYNLLNKYTLNIRNADQITFYDDWIVTYKIMTFEEAFKILIINKIDIRCVNWPKDTYISNNMGKYNSINIYSQSNIKNITEEDILSDWEIYIEDNY